MDAYVVFRPQASFAKFRDRDGDGIRRKNCELIQLFLGFPRHFLLHCLVLENCFDDQIAIHEISTLIRGGYPAQQFLPLRWLEGSPLDVFIDAFDDVMTRIKEGVEIKVADPELEAAVKAQNEPAPR